jgi:hypothetical protein
MTIDKKLWQNRKQRKELVGDCDRRTQAWRWSIPTLRVSMWAIVRITLPCGRTAIQNRCADSSVSAQICIG